MHNSWIKKYELFAEQTQKQLSCRSESSGAYGGLQFDSKVTVFICLMSTTKRNRGVVLSYNQRGAPTRPVRWDHFSRPCPGPGLINLLHVVLACCSGCITRSHFVADRDESLLSWLKVFQAKVARLIFDLFIFRLVTFSVQSDEHRDSKSC